MKQVTIMVESFLDFHVSQLLVEDRHFSTFWDAQTQKQKDRYLTIWRTLGCFVGMENREVRRQHLAASDFTKRWFVRVQEMEFTYSAIRADWAAVARSQAALNLLFNQAAERLQHFLDIANVRSDVFFYGGIKPLDSIDKKLLEDRNGNAVQRNLTDLWDLVRFRFVTNDLEDLLSLAIQFWELFFDDVIRCRNYYYRPRNGVADDAYRAIHMELRDRESNLVEIQMMTANREAVSLLDHWFLFKGFGSFVSEEHKEWLEALSLAANVLDSDSFSRSDVGAGEQQWMP